LATDAAGNVVGRVAGLVDEVEAVLGVEDLRIRQKVDDRRRAMRPEAAGAARGRA
jgi:hypothetical protein